MEVNLTIEKKTEHISDFTDSDFSKGKNVSDLEWNLQTVGSKADCLSSKIKVKNVQTNREDIRGRLMKEDARMTKEAALDLLETIAFDEEGNVESPFWWSTIQSDMTEALNMAKSALKEKIEVV